MWVLQNNRWPRWNSTLKYITSSPTHSCSKNKNKRWSCCIPINLDLPFITEHQTENTQFDWRIFGTLYTRWQKLRHSIPLFINSREIQYDVIIDQCLHPPPLLPATRLPSFPILTSYWISREFMKRRIDVLLIRDMPYSLEILRLFKFQMFGPGKRNKSAHKGCAKSRGAQMVPQVAQKTNIMYAKLCEILTAIRERSIFMGKRDREMSSGGW